MGRQRMSQAFGRDAGSAVSPLPEGSFAWQLSRPPLVARRMPEVPPVPHRPRRPRACTSATRRKILSYCLHQLGSREEAEDAVQTTFMNAFRALGRGVVPEAESAWLFKIAENVCLSRRRSSWRRGRIESPSDFDVIEEVVPGPSRQRDELIGIEDALAVDAGAAAARDPPARVAGPLLPGDLGGARALAVRRRDVDLPCPALARPGARAARPDQASRSARASAAPCT